MKCVQSIVYENSKGIVQNNLFLKYSGSLTASKHIPRWEVYKQKIPYWIWKMSKLLLLQTVTTSSKKESVQSIEHANSKNVIENENCPKS